MPGFFFSTSWLYFPQGKKGDICRKIDSKVLAGKGSVTFKKGMGGIDDVFSSLRCNFRVCAEVHVYVQGNPNYPSPKLPPPPGNKGLIRPY